MYMIRLTLTTVFLSLIFNHVVAQFNDSTNYYVNLGSTGIINRTNDRSSWISNNAFRFSVYKKHISLNSSSSFIYGEQQNMLSNRDFLSGLDFNYYLGGRPVYFFPSAAFSAASWLVLRT